MRITFHRFNLPDSEDPAVMAAEPIWQWQQTDHGRWVMRHARNLTFHTQLDHLYWGHDIAITGDLDDSGLITEYYLRYLALDD